MQQLPGDADGLPELPSFLLSRLVAAFDATAADARIRTLAEEHPEHRDALHAWLSRIAASVSTAPSTDAALAVPSLLERLGLDDAARPRIALPGDATQREGEGQRLGKYELGDRIGRGSFGEVFRAVDLDLGRTVAIKFQHRGHGADPDLVRRFLEEAQIGAQLQHPGILPVYEVSSSDERLFFVMKLASHDSWHEALRARRAPAEDLQRHLAIFLQVCQTMAYAHSRAVIHRDLKPVHVLLGRFGEVQVVDWGLGKVLDQAGTASHVESPIATERSRAGMESLAGAQMGSPSYMPPEQARGETGKVDRRSDVFGLGAILCEVLTGAPIYDAPDERDPERRMLRVLAMAKAAELAPARERLASCGADPELIELCRDCLHESPDSRPADAAIVAARLGVHLEQVQARADQDRVQAARARTRQRWFAALATAVAVGLTVALWLWRDVAARQRDFDQLSFIVQLDRANERSAELWPAWPAATTSLLALRDVALPLVAAAPRLRTSIESLQELATREPDGTFRFPDDMGSREVLHEALTRVVRDIAKFERTVVDGRPAGTVDDPDEPFHDRGIDARIRWSTEVVGLTVEAHRSAWQDAREAVARADGESAHSAYGPPGRIDLQPQIGLVPIGPDPETKLWEFHHLRSAKSPDVAVERDTDGRLVRTDSMGLVFVLVPGGSFVMGQQSNHEDHPRYLARADVNEAEPHDVTLAPFLMSKFEMTQAQWYRLTGTKPSQLGQGSPFVESWGTHPVEKVTWNECDALLRELGLTLPTEAQWEYACRASSDAPWGVSREQVDRFANLADVHAQGNGGHESWLYSPELDDGFVGHAPIGSLAANAFGLHDMLGNVEEWCRDRFHRYGGEVDPQTGLRLGDSVNASRMVRGGSFSSHPDQARPSHRYSEMPEIRNMMFGVRPARSLL